MPASGPGRGPECSSFGRRQPVTRRVQGAPRVSGEFPSGLVRDLSHRATCLDCHRPDATRQNTYHPAQFLTRHPSSAYSREANCSDRHNRRSSARAVTSSQLVATARLGKTGYHDVSATSASATGRRRAEPRVVRRVSCGARLHGVSFRGERRVPLQPSWPWLQRGSDASEEPDVMHRVSRQRDSERPMTRGR